MPDIKLYPCENCGREVVLRSRIKSGDRKGTKVCSNCYNQIMRPLSDSKVKVRSKYSKVKKVLPKKDYDALKAYFEYHSTKKWNPTCENCGYPLQDMNKKNCAHIVPKSIFRSVATNLDNEMDLCTTFDREDGKTGCHEQYDASWEVAVEMPVFEIARSRFEKFRHLIEEQHKILDNFEENKS